MFIDASVLVAILLRESDADELAGRFEVNSRRVTSPLVVWETAVAVSRALNLTIPEAAAAVDAYLREMGITVVAVAPELASMALDAFDRFGKGRHPAALNFGDCFAYACARWMELPLLFKGHDFSLTDIQRA